MARKSVDSELWRLRPSTWWKVWCYILLHVQHKDFKELKKGQGYFNFRKLVRANAFGGDVTYSIVDHFVRYAKMANMLATQKATHGTLITVHNYALYQNLDSYKSETSGDNIGESPAKSRRNPGDNINNNEKNEEYISEDNGNLKPLSNLQRYKLASTLRVDFMDVCKMEKKVLRTENIAKYKIKSVYLTTRNWLERKIDKGEQPQLDDIGMMVLKSLYENICK